MRISTGASPAQSMEIESRRETVVGDGGKGEREASTKNEVMIADACWEEGVLRSQERQN